MHSQWEPLPSDVADWMGMGAVGRRGAPPITRIRPHGLRGLVASLAVWLHLRH